ncbi:MAG: hypothetical protein KGH69_04285 [Candidatus Micrarchaeota archaeon]|nr:hypothetical protein [Candidatus Micrarchaeota archaeon]
MAANPARQAARPIYFAIAERIERDGDPLRAQNAWRSAATFATKDGDRKGAKECIANARRCSEAAKKAVRSA